MALRLGVDLGGTKIEIIALTDDGRTHGRRRVPTPRGDYAGTLRAIAGLVRSVEGESGPADTIGIGMPGAVSPVTGLMKNANSVWLNGRSFGPDIAAVLGRPVVLANDANCFALSEAVDGAAEGARVTFGVIVGTGTGGGVVVEGRVVEGRQGIAGEWGHNMLPWPAGRDEWPGPSCYCGRTGCIETFLSGPGLCADYVRNGGHPCSGGAEVYDRAERGEVTAAEALERYVDRMARALASVINVLDPDVVVLGGGVSNMRVLYDRVPQRWGRYAFSDTIDTPLRPARHGDSSGVRGAAWLGRARREEERT